MSYWEEKLPPQLNIKKNDSGISVFEPRPKHVADLLWQSVKNNPDKLALVFQEIKMTFAELGEMVKRVAFHLQNEYHVQQGDRVALLLGNGIMYPISFFALAEIGAVSVPLNVRLSPAEIIYQLEKSKCSIVITENEFWEGISNQALETCCFLDYVFVSEKPQKQEKLFSELTKECEGVPKKQEISETDTCCIFFTSGTTGNPKGAELTHLGLVATGMNFAITFELSEDDSTIMMVPLFHITGKLQFLGAIYEGIPVYIMKHYQTEELFNLIEKYQPTVLVGVPTMYWFLLSSDRFHPDAFSSIRAILYGGAPAPVDLIMKLQELLPHIKIHNGYGLTEGHGLDTLLPNKDAMKKQDSVGLPVPLVEAKIVDNFDNELSPNQVGELVVRSPKIINGYFENEEATKKAIRNGWLYTGDLARMDEEGYIYIVDRKSDMINRSGEKVYSIEIENILYSFPKVLEAAVVGIPDKVFGEQIKAVIVLKPGLSSTLEEIKEFCDGKLASYKIPKVIEFVDELPRNAGGKVLKRQLI